MSRGVGSPGSPLVRRSTARIRAMTSSRLNGFVSVVVAAEGQAADLVLGRVARGQEHHRHAGAAAPQPPDDIEAVHVREHDVKHDEVGPVPLRGLHGLGTRRGGDDVESGVPQAGGEQFQDVRLVLDDEQPGIRSQPFIAGQHLHAQYCHP